MCQTPSDISFFLFVLALFTLKLLPWVSKAQDLKVSAEALWSKLGKSAEKCYKTKGQKRNNMQSPAQPNVFFSLGTSWGLLSPDGTNTSFIFI